VAMRDEVVEETKEKEGGKKEEETDAAAAEEKAEDKNKEEHSFLSFFSNAGKGIVDGGLNVLETVGKKTMKVINETDPGLNKTKSIFAEQRGKINLSQMLRDAKKDREENEKREEEFIETQKTKFDYWFEEKQGLVYLEALEILSGESEKELEKSIKENGHSKSDLLSIRDKFLQSRESEDGSVAEEAKSLDGNAFFVALQSNIKQLGVHVSCVKLEEARSAADAAISKAEEAMKKKAVPTIEVVKEGKEETKEEEEKEAQKENAEVNSAEKEDSSSSPPTTSSGIDADSLVACHQNAVMALGDVVAKCIQFFHKVDQMLLMTPSKDGDHENAWIMESVAAKIEALYRVKTMFVSEIDRIASRFAQALTILDADPDAKTRTDQVITAVFLEASHGSSFIEEAYNLSIPVMQKCFFDKTQVS